MPKIDEEKLKKMQEKSKKRHGHYGLWPHSMQTSVQPTKFFDEPSREPSHVDFNKVKEFLKKQ